MSYYAVGGIGRYVLTVILALGAIGHMWKVCCGICHQIARRRCSDGQTIRNRAHRWCRRGRRRARASVKLGCSNLPRVSTTYGSRANNGKAGFKERKICAGARGMEEEKWFRNSTQYGGGYRVGTYIARRPTNQTRNESVGGLKRVEKDRAPNWRGGKEDVEGSSAAAEKRKWDPRRRHRRTKAEAAREKENLTKKAQRSHGRTATFRRVVAVLIIFVGFYSYMPTERAAVNRRVRGST